MIREMKEKDAEQVLLMTTSQTFEDQTYTGGSETHEDILNRWAKIGLVSEYKGEIVYLVDERDGELVGYCSMSIGTDGQTVMGELVGMYVKPEHRRKGIALDLMNRLTEVADERGVDVIFAWTRREARAAKALYEKAGYRENAQPIYYFIVSEEEPSKPLQ
jgi:ribosomal protein S18 acetylase RimI-like enzyme